MSDVHHKIQIKLSNGAEFSAEGSEAAVNEQFKLFLEVAKQLPSAASSQNKAEKQGEGPHSGAGDEAFDRVFKVDTSSNSVSLKILPQTDSELADGIILLLYGFDQAFGNHSVLGSDLLQAARASGLGVNRVDKTVANHMPFITTAGAKRGRRYGLNNRGIAHAKEVLAALL